MRLPPPPPDETATLAAAPAYGLLVLAFGLHLTVGSQLQRAWLPFGIAYGQVLFFFGLAFLAVVALGQSPRRFFALAPPPARTWPWVVLAALAGFFLAGGLNALNQWLVGEDLARLFDSTRVLRHRPVSEQVAVALAVTLLAPFGEEFLFRGYLLRVLRARHGTGAALLLTSLLFAVMHLNPASFAALLALGLLFGLLRILSGSLLPSIVAHAVQNGTTALVVLFEQAPESETIELGLATLFVAGALPPITFGLAQIRRLADPPSGEPALVPARGFDLERIRVPIAVWLGTAFVWGFVGLSLA